MIETPSAVTDTPERAMDVRGRRPTHAEVPSNEEVAR